MAKKENLLKKYIDENRLTYIEFSYLIGCCSAAVWGWARGRNRPRPENALKIHKKTKGQVPLEFWGYQKFKKRVVKL